MKMVCVLGDGSWGTAISTLLAHTGFTVKLWCYQKEVADVIASTRYNKRYLPGIKLSSAIIPTSDFQEAVSGVTWIFEAIPVQYMRNVLSSYKKLIEPEQQWVVLSKGIEKETLLLPSQLIDDVLDFNPSKVALVGPSYAKDLAEKQITAVSLAATDCDLGLQIQKMLANEYFRPYISLDLIGAQVGGAIKNIIALAIGMLDGAGFTDNAKVFILTVGLSEMATIAQVLGGKPETVYGLSGVGDLVLTSMGTLSKNREVGKRLGAGQTLETILKDTGYIPEGVNTVKSVYQLMKHKNLDLPVCRGVYDVINNQKTISDVLQTLMARPLEQECPSR
jgi:glycerol-3-phosphate dehydrogenase (NAD(P)+)